MAESCIQELLLQLKDHPCDPDKVKYPSSFFFQNRFEDMEATSIQSANAA